jgi:hypothetical protein
MRDFTTIRNNVNIYYLNEYFKYLEEKNESKKALLIMRKNNYLKKFLGYRVGAYKIIGVFEDENVFALYNGKDIIYLNVEDVLKFMKALEERV